MFTRCPMPVQSTERNAAKIYSSCLFPVVLFIIHYFCVGYCHATMIRNVAGQRCLFVKSGAVAAATTTTTTTAKTTTTKPPVVLLGGTAQSIAAWEQHVPGFNKDRAVLLYEARGQGPEAARQDHLQESLLDKVSLEYQADYLKASLEELQLEQVDLVGFSFGGRVAMAMALQHPNLIRKLHVTGVAVDRSPLGKLTIDSWKDHLSHKNSDLTSFAWSILLATYSPDFLQTLQQQGKLEGILAFITRENTREGLLALFEQTHWQQESDWTTRSIAERLQKNSKIVGRACVGEFDYDMAPLQYVEELTDLLQWPPPTIIPNCGHAAPMEQPRLWRNQALEFLNTSS